MNACVCVWFHHQHPRRLGSVGEGSPFQERLNTFQGGSMGVTWRGVTAEAVGHKEASTDAFEGDLGPVAFPFSF